MLISKVHFVNFGCFKDFQYTFTKGIYVFSGDNGQGKSTVFRGLLLLLLDTYDGVLDDYVRWETEEFFIEVEFSHLGHTYLASVKRNLSSATTDRTLTIDNTPTSLRTGQEAINKLKVILDPELTKASMIIMEQQIDLIRVKAAARRDHLKRIYDLEFAKELELIAEDASSLAEKEISVRGRLADLYNKKYDLEIVPEIPPIDRDSLINRKKTYTDALQSLAVKKSEFNAATRDLALANSALTLANKNMESSTSTRKALELKLSSYPEAEKRKNAEDILSLCQEELKNLRSVDADVALIDSEVERLVFVRLDAFDTSPLIDVKTRINALISEAERLSKAPLVCHACGRSLPLEDIQKNKDRLKEIEESLLPELQNKESELEREKERYDQLQKENTLNADTRENLLKKKQNLQSAYQSEKSSKEAAVARAESVLSNLGVTIKAEKDLLVKDIESAIEKETSCAKELTEAEETLKSLSSVILEDPADKILLYEKEVESIEVDISNYDRIIVQREEVSRHNAVILKSKEDDETTKKSLELEIQQIAKKMGDLEACKKILKTDFPVWVIARIVKDIEKNMNTFIQKTYGGRYQIDIVDKNNALAITYGPKKQDVALSSGYERQVFGVAYLHAISQFQNTRAIWMDEPDSAASESNSKILFKVLGDSRGFFDQMFIVSHKPKTRDLLKEEYGAHVIEFVEGVAYSE